MLIIARYAFTFTRSDINVGRRVYSLVHNNSRQRLVHFVVCPMMDSLHRFQEKSSHEQFLLSITFESHVLHYS